MARDQYQVLIILVASDKSGPKPEEKDGQYCSGTHENDYFILFGVSEAHDNIDGCNYYDVLYEYHAVTPN